METENLLLLFAVLRYLLMKERRSFNFCRGGDSKGSVPEKEAVETFAKMQTMLKVVFGDNVKICDGGTRERSV